MENCLINPSGRPNKFYADDRFGETIVKLNKEKIRPSANATTDAFFRDTVAPNVLTLWRCKTILAQATGATNHGNRHKVVETYPDVQFVVGLLLSEDIFTEQPGRGSGENIERATRDLYVAGYQKLATGVPLANYIRRARGNWGQSGQEKDASLGVDLDVDLGSDTDDLSIGDVSEDDEE